MTAAAKAKQAPGGLALRNPPLEAVITKLTLRSVYPYGLSLQECSQNAVENHSGHYSRQLARDTGGQQSQKGARASA